MVRAVGGTDELLELVVEALVAKIALLFGHPFLQPEMRFDLEFRHGSAPKVRCKGFVVPDRSRVLSELVARPALRWLCQIATLWSNLFQKRNRIVSSAQKKVSGVLRPIRRKEQRSWCAR